MAKIALIIPNIKMNAEFGEVSDPPIGLASIGGSLAKQGHDVIIIDGMAENLNEKEILFRIADFRPSYIGIGCNYCTLHNPTLSLAKLLKEVYGRAVFIFVGGNHATSLCKELLMQSQGDIDCIARGEGETVTRDIVEALENGASLGRILGITYTENGVVFENASRPLIANLDELGMPAYHLLPMDRYRRYNIVSSRGCPYSCDYCASTAIFTRKVRYRSPAAIIAEMEYLFKTYGDRHFWFSDDTFIVNQAHTREVLHSIISHDIPFKWSCLTTINSVKADLIELIMRAGCKYISFGVETGNQKMLSKIGKTVSYDEIVKTSLLCRTSGMPHYGFFIFGFPGESWETIYDSYKLIHESAFDGGGMNILIPLPGTKLWKYLYEEKKYFTFEDMKWDELFARLSTEEYISFSAQLASKWCDLTGSELVEACKIGQRMFKISEHIGKA